MEKVAVTGATGLLGGNLAIELRRRGHEVVATKRASSKTAHLDGHGIQWVDANLSDPDALTAAFEGCGAVYHCAAVVHILPAPTPEMEQGNVEGTRNVVDAARRANVSRLVHCSSTVTTAISDDGQPVTEDSTWNLDHHGLNDGYAKTKRAAEDIVIEAAKNDLDAVIVNPAYMFGPLDSRPSSGKLVMELAQRRVPAYTAGWNNFVDVRAVARGMIAARERGVRGRRYILGGENMSYRDLMRRVAGHAGVKPPRFGVPKLVALAAAAPCDLVQRIRKKEAFLNSTKVKWSFCKGYLLSSQRAIDELGYDPGSLDAGIKDCLTWFRDQGMLRH